MPEDVGISLTNSPITSSSHIKQDIPGSLVQFLGEGENAKNSIVYLVIKYSFLSAAFLIILLVGINLIFNYPGFKNNFFFDGIKNIWSIFAPFVTLALGYLFGKGKI